MKRRGHRRGNYILALAMLFVLGAVWGLSRWLSSPAEGSTGQVSRLQPTAAKVQPTDAPDVAKVDTNPYYSLAVPAEFQVQAQQSTTPGLLHSQNIIKRGSMGSLLIAIAVKTMPEGDLGADPGYRLRANDPDRYAKTMLSHGVVLMNDRDQAAIAAFWPHGDRMATISVSSGIDNPAMDENRDAVEALQTLLKGWQWR